MMHVISKVVPQLQMIIIYSLYVKNEKKAEWAELQDLCRIQLQEVMNFLNPKHGSQLNQ